MVDEMGTDEERRAYDRCFGVMRSDFLRYFALHRFGGVWFDTDCECIVPVDRWEVTGSCAVGREIRLTKEQQLCNWCMAAERQHPLMARAVAVVCDNLLRARPEVLLGLSAEERVYELTGPKALTRAAIQSPDDL